MNSNKAMMRILPDITDAPPPDDDPCFAASGLDSFSSVSSVWPLPSLLLDVPVLPLLPDEPVSPELVVVSPLPEFPLLLGLGLPLGLGLGLLLGLGLGLLLGLGLGLGLLLGLGLGLLLGPGLGLGLLLGLGLGLFPVLPDGPGSILLLMVVVVGAGVTSTGVGVVRARQVSEAVEDGQLVESIDCLIL